MTSDDLRRVIALTRSEDRSVRRKAQTLVTAEAVRRYRAFEGAMMGRTPHTAAECQRINIEWHVWLEWLRDAAGPRLYNAILNECLR